MLQYVSPGLNAKNTGMQTSMRFRDRSLAAEDTTPAFWFENETAPYLICDANNWLFGERSPSN